MIVLAELRGRSAALTGQTIITATPNGDGRRGNDMADHRMLDAALRYAQQGWAVFPLWAPTQDGRCTCDRGAACQHPGKHPMGRLAPRGFRDATTDRETITRWWTAAPEANIGVWAGGSGLVVIDIDKHDADGFATWAALQAQTPGLDCDTVCAQTGGGGRHTYFVAPAGVKLAAKLGPGVDVKSNGGYVVAPPSRHASGRRYTFAPGRNPVQMRPTLLPPALLALLTQERRDGDSRTGNVTRTDPVVGPIDQAADRAEDEYPGDVFARTHSWRDILEPHGWHFSHRKDRTDYWTRPGKGPHGGVSAATGGGKGDVLWVWSTNASPFQPEVSYTKFGAYAALEHGGDFTAAARQLYIEQESAAAAAGPGNDAGAGLCAGSGSSRAPAHGSRGGELLRKVKSADLVKFLEAQGWRCRLNICDDSIEVNGERLSDVMRAQMRSRLRDAGLGKFLAAAEDALLADAARRPYHPVREYLEGLQWDGYRQIADLAGHFTDAHGVFGLYLRKWLVGAVARAYTGQQNAMLVLDGPQGVGKSAFARWLCPLPGLFVDGGISPDSKDCSLLALRSWIWEVSELGATTRRNDVEALKGFLSREVFTLRPAYGHYDIMKPALASFIGTVNNSGGLFSDPTGSRRFWATTVTAIDWSYQQKIDVHQLWAEACKAYKEGELWTLTPEEAQQAREINANYEVEDPVENLLRRQYHLDPEDREHWTSTADILLMLQANGLQGNTRANAMLLSDTLKRLGFCRHEVNKAKGYWGVW